MTSPASELPRPITLLVNAHSRKGRALFEDAEQAVREAGIPLAEAVAVHSPEEAAQVLQREIKAQARLVIVGGGDGTLSACADHLVHTGVAMGVLPMGTGNTFARSLGLPLGLPEAARAIADGHIEAVDVGRVNQQIFLNSVTIGLSAEIAEALDKKTKARLGLLAWPVVGGKTILRHRPNALRIVAPGRTMHVRTHQLVVANGRYVAGPIAAAPESSVQDSTLDVFTLGGSTLASLAHETFLWLTGRHHSSPDTRSFGTRKLRVESLRRAVVADVDGELNEHTPLDMEVLPGALRVAVPRGFVAHEA